MDSSHIAPRHEAWNKGKLVGQKAPFKLREIWGIRVRLQMQSRLRELALFDLASTASCAPAIWSACESATCAMAIALPHGQSCRSRRLSVRFSSRSHHQPARRSRRGSSTPA